MGAALFPTDGHSLEKLYRKADIALYHIKDRGKAGFCYYSEEIEKRSKKASGASEQCKA
jgi:predicted signal transduction protein with EAL and GGDEF domain